MTPSSPLPQSIEMYCAVARIERTADERLREKLSLSFSQALVLLFIKQSQPQVCQRTIAQHCGMTEASVSRQIDYLVGSGWVDRAEDAANRRQYMLTLTPAGRQHLRQALQTITQTFEQAASEASPPEQQAVEKNLQRLLSA